MELWAAKESHCWLKKVNVPVAGHGSVRLVIADVAVFISRPKRRHPVWFVVENQAAMFWVAVSPSNAAVGTGSPSMESARWSTDRPTRAQPVTTAANAAKAMAGRIMASCALKSRGADSSR